MVGVREAFPARGRLPVGASTVSSAVSEKSFVSCSTGPRQVAGAAFVFDARIEEHDKETVHQICQTIRVADQFAEQK
jgi:hypothetical protein